MTTTKKDRKPTSESIVREIKRRTRRKFSTEEKIRIVLDGLRGETSIADLCRREGLHPTMYYKWSKAFMEEGKNRLNGDTIREVGSDEVKGFREENDEFKMAVAELTIRVRKLKKTFPDLESGSNDT